MKKNFALVLLLGYLNMCAMAQIDAEFSWISVNQTDPTTLTVFNKSNASDSVSEGSKLCTGILTSSIILSCDSVPEDAPDITNTTEYISYADVYGVAVREVVDSTALNQLNEALCYVENFIEKYNTSISVNRGGRYTFRNSFPGIGYDYSKVVEIVDKPSVHLTGSSVTIGQDFDISACFNTGYPFNPEQFHVTEPAQLTLYSVGVDSCGNMQLVAIASQKTELDLYRPDQPLIAAVDTMTMKVEHPVPGEYLMKLVSDYPFQESSQEFFLTVKDTLRLSATLDKKQYTTADQNALLTVGLDYGYPHIAVTEGADKPQFTVCLIFSELIGEEPEQEWSVINNVEIPYAHDSLATCNLNESIEFEVEIPYLNQLRKAKSDKVMLDVVIKFNGKIQGRQQLIFSCEAVTDGLTKLNTLFEEAVVYDLIGRRIPKGKKLQGIYVENGKIKICK